MGSGARALALEHHIARVWVVRSSFSEQAPVLVHGFRPHIFVLTNLPCTHDARFNAERIFHQACCPMVPHALATELSPTWQAPPHAVV